MKRFSSRTLTKRLTSLAFAGLTQCLTGWATADSLPLSIEYFGINGHTAERINRLPPSIQFTEYNLDAQRNLENSLSANLPQDLDEATKITETRLAALPKHTMEDLFTGVIGAGNYGLTRVPAVVFNHGDTVVYGVEDVSVALDLWQHPEQWATSSHAPNENAISSEGAP